MSKKPIPDEVLDNPWFSEHDNNEPSISTAGPSQTYRHSENNTVTATLNNDEPPIYSSGPSHPIDANPSTLTNNFLPGLPHLDFSRYKIPESTLSKDQCVVTTTLSSLYSDPRALETFVREQAALPPRPHVYLTGVRGQTVDFNIKLNMLRYIIHPNEKWNFVKVSPLHQKPSKKSEAQGDGLGEWARRFCKDSSLMKSFIIQREVINWNTDLIEGRIRSLLASIGYRGQVHIQFPITHAQVIVHSAPKAPRIFTNLLSSVVDTKKYDAVKVYWPYATLGPDANTAGSSPRRCAVQSEEGWWKDWCDVIRSGVLAGRSGWLSLDDQIELAMNPTAKSSEKPGAWALER